ncbi:phage tail protein [Sulfurospirillum sp. hDNRA2]|uniref:phage tail protein n=1 Tax=Sulfurospirillum sp. hDNRA2 TaxID=3237298 RepID=UPI0020B8D691|nr:tail fiber protein [Sulfurospirillum sp. DNRA8]MCP3651432.1 tail fiber protein [Sulfurospirillum sp. DNRA8]MCR1810279.1 tail fiber protein [Sulfurospirillum sp. DNRA8]
MDFVLGQIQLFAFHFEMEGWLLCDGRALPISQNQALFSHLGTTYGGDGHSTFCIPNLKDKAPLPELRYYIAIQGLYPMRSM